MLAIILEVLNMATYNVRLYNKKKQIDETISVEEDTTILQAAEDAGI